MTIITVKYYSMRYVWNDGYNISTTYDGYNKSTTYDTHLDVILEFSVVQ